MDPVAPIKKPALDKDLKSFVRLEAATHEAGLRIGKLGLGLLFLIGVWIFVSLQAETVEHSAFIIAAGIIGGYMALNIGANDVANNVGPAVGSKALTMIGALVIASIFEAAGAIIAGGDVISTISKGIIDPSQMENAEIFMTAMMAALLAAALWLNLATYFNAPVSTTHSIVGGVMGAGIAATGISAVNWLMMGKIAASWIISPVLGGIVAAAFLFFIKKTVLYQDDKIAAAKRWVPVLVGIMASAFAMYLTMKGLKKVWKPDSWMILMIGLSAFVATYLPVKATITKAARTLENRRKDINSLFVIPLICSAALLSFAHGANDVANAVGPLAAIVNAASSGDIAAKVGIPLWVMVVGAIGISAGLMLFGPKLIRTVGEKITKLNPVRAFCVALSASITVIVASTLGLPVSSTHIAVGAIFGVGFFREFIANRRDARLALQGNSTAASAAAARIAASPSSSSPASAKDLRKIQKRRLVRRRHLLTIAAAWIITVPAAALLAGALYVLMIYFS
jgi:inorganic phosphate transporter, PiT family